MLILYYEVVHSQPNLASPHHVESGSVPNQLLGLIFWHGFNLRISSGIDTGILAHRRMPWSHKKIIAQNLVICREPSNLGLKSNWAIITLYVTLERWNIFSAAAELQLEKHHLAGPPQSIDIDWFKTELRQNLQDHELYRDNMSKIKGPFVWDKFHRKPSVIRGFNRTVIPKKIPKDPNMKILKLCIDR